MHSFTEIGKAIGVSKQRAKQIFDEAINKLSSALSEEEMEDINEILLEMQQQGNIHDSIAESMFQQSLEGDGLEGFWNEGHAQET